MSLIALTDRLHAGRTVARTLLLLIAVTGAVIVGLLAMHSLNAHTATDTGHPASVTSTASTGSGDHHAGSTATDEACADCGSGHSGDRAVAGAARGGQAMVVDPPATETLGRVGAVCQAGPTSAFTHRSLHQPYVMRPNRPLAPVPAPARPSS